MKILVLMPCDERYVYAAAGIYKALPHELKEKTFAMPMFMDYLIQTKVVGNWIMAFYDAIISAKAIYNSTQPDEDLIIIGNIPSECEFDAVFSFQDIEETLTYEDKFIEKIKNLVEGDQLLTSTIADLHKVDEVKLALRNCTATADFLTRYITTDIKNKLEKLQKEYEDKLDFKVKGVDVNGFSG